MRWMALDHGTKNIGIAFSDELEILASPFEVWPNLGEATLARLVRLARETIQVAPRLTATPASAVTSTRPPATCGGAGELAPSALAPSALTAPALTAPALVSSALATPGVAHRAAMRRAVSRARGRSLA